MNNNQTPNFGQNGPSFNKENVRPMRPVKKVPIFQVILGIVVLIFLLIGSSFFYVVAEDEVAVVKVFNETKKIIVDTDNDLAEIVNELDDQFRDVEVIKDKGLFFKIPFITTVEKHSSKLQTYISNEGQVTTSDKVKFEVKLFAQWEITHPGLYETNYGSIVKASSRIDETLYADIISLINNLESTEFLNAKEVLYEALESKMALYNEKNQATGIYIHDLEIYRVGIPQSNYESVYRKMNEDRFAKAASIRAEGEQELTETKSNVDLEVEGILADADEESKRTRGQADAEVIKIYAEAYGQDPDFYEFWRTLKAYEVAIDENTTIFLDKSNPFLKYFSSMPTDFSDEEPIVTE